MKSNSHAFVNQFVVWMLVTITCGGTVGLGTVWMRHKISVTANANRILAGQIAEIERHVADVVASVEREQNHDALRQRNQAWNLGLVPMTDAQVQHVDVDVVQRLAAKSNRELFSSTNPARLSSLESAARSPTAKAPPARVTVDFAQH
jgi:hypothetical protein